MKGKIFNAQEVQAIIDGKKTMFREVIKPKLDDRANCGLGIHDNGQLLWDARDDCGYYKNYDEIKCPYQVGETIFVKESFSKLLIHSGHQYYYPAHCIRECVDRDNGFHYWADGNPEFGDWESPRPATHMKQEHSRLFLRITKIKVERLLDISEEDCLKSGVKCLAGEEIADTGDYFESEYYFGELKEKIKECGCIYGCACNVYDPTSDFVNTHDNPFDPFMEFWDSNHKKPEHKWDADPWVFVYEFEVLDLKK